ncbi:uncharacterized protein SCHCODRAFT_02317286 [Schizophyllum commune H4-8]|uniref:uncharacterized protein n=1 Tax=Schizophyllum commune (strain H4-8 / FGSC 9210) TaxID=578458 RepID=UPI00215E9FF5|nr:uncharacterized protein SCHCODRAFT_02317286 [Schizophyllum commune H4-8]KAI5891354.1 hypothetical protein SCHCODRAFT_02317286 [Schizophyllum commune H4-8]
MGSSSGLVGEREEVRRGRGRVSGREKVKRSTMANARAITSAAREANWAHQQAPRRLYGLRVGACRPPPARTHEAGRTPALVSRYVHPCPPAPARPGHRRQGALRVYVLASRTHPRFIGPRGVSNTSSQPPAREWPLSTRRQGCRVERRRGWPIPCLLLPISL